MYTHRKPYLFLFYMKKIYYLLLIFFVLYTSCQQEENIPLQEVRLSGSPVQPSTNRIDAYIEENFRKPYNMEVQYKFNDNEFDQSRVLIPADTAVIIPILTALKTVWLDNYVKLGGDKFMKQYSPKMIVISGGKNFNGNGTITQGVAEAAQKITLFQANEYTPKNAYIIQQYFVIMQHEFAHILNQKKLFDIKAYEAITPAAYLGDWYNYKTSQALELGVITPYGMSNVNEDFAEMVATILTNDTTSYKDIFVDNQTSEKAIAKIKQKEAIIYDYYKSAFNIDLYALRDSMYKYTQIILKN